MRRTPRASASSGVEAGSKSTPREAENAEATTAEAWSSKVKLEQAAMSSNEGGPLPQILATDATEDVLQAMQQAVRLQEALRQGTSNAWGIKYGRAQRRGTYQRRHPRGHSDTNHTTPSVSKGRGSTRCRHSTDVRQGPCPERPAREAGPATSEKPGN